MTLMIHLLDGMLDEADLLPEGSVSAPEGRAAHECDGCGGFRPDVDLWATNSETGEELWLCEACAEF